jgi:AraC-like DNA-binding protein
VPEFTLEQTTLYSGNSRQFVASSQGLGWTDLFAAVTEELPHETLHRAIPDVWLASALTAVDIQRVAPRYEQNQILPKGTITITGADEPVYDKTAAALKVAYVFLRREMIDDVADDLFRDSRERRYINSLLCSDDMVLQRLVASIMALLKDRLRCNRLEVDYLSQALAARLLEKHSVVGPVSSVPRIHSFNSMEIGRIVEYINGNLAADLSVTDLARLVGLGRAQFILRFKATTTLTPHQFVILRRIWRARNMLVERGWDQESIAQQCGFASRAHFVTSFGKVVGMTPHEYRQLVMG